MQHKDKEITFFDSYADSQGDYNVFTERSTVRIVDSCLQFSGLQVGVQVIDLGCGSGAFTKILHNYGFLASGLDISPGLIRVAHQKYDDLEFKVGDVEALPFASDSLDGIMLSGIIHHLPDPSACAAEIFRVLKPQGIFIAFDPNRLNPFMWLYRDKSSPLYSNKGVTENERPIVATEVAEIFTKAGFHISTDYLSGLQYQYIASSSLRWAIPIYNFLDDVLFRLPWLKPYSAFVLTNGVKK